MKKTLLLVFVLLSLMFVSCVTSFDRTLLQHSAGSIDPKLPNLELKNEDSDYSVGRSNSKSLSTNTYLYTIFERECENNLIEWNGDETWGTIDLVLIDASFDPIDMWSLSTSVYVEFELRIFDVNGKKIWANQYYRDGGNIVVWSYAQVESEAQTKIVKTFKELIEEAKVDLRKETPDIIAKLERAIAKPQ
jgi:hypothetical protein